MIYEVRMTVTFTFGGKPKEARVFVEPEPERRIKTTLIEYIEANGVAEAFNKAAERKHEIIVDVGKGEAEVWDRKAWGPRSKTISISLDAVVAKPELDKKMLFIIDKGELKMVSYRVNKKYDEVTCKLTNGKNLKVTGEVLRNMWISLKNGIRY